MVMDGDKLRRGVRRSRLLAAALGAATALVARAPRADPEEAIRVDYQASAGCPDEASFLADLRARTSRWHLAQGPAVARRFEVGIRQEASRSVGWLAVVETSGARSRREIQGARCRDVMDALALMTALAIDPRAALSLRVPVPAPPPSTGPVIEPQPPRPPLRPLATERPAPPRWRLSTGTHAVAAGGVAPSMVPGLDAFVELALARSSPLAPSLRATIRGYESAPVVTAAGRARFARLLGGIEACPVRAALADVVSLVPCAAVDVGGTSSTGEVPLGLHETRTWIDMGATGHVDGWLSQRTAVELEGGALFLPLAYRFAFPDLVAYRTPAVSGFVGLGASVRF